MINPNVGVIVVDNGVRLVPVVCELDNRGVAQGVITTDEEKIRILEEMIEMVKEDAKD